MFEGTDYVLHTRGRRKDERARGGGQLFNKGRVLNKYIFTTRTPSSEYIYTHAEQL